MSMNFDALLPIEMAKKAEEIGVKKAQMSAVKLFILAVLAGAFIALGAIFATTVAAGASALPYGIARLVIGSVFSLGLILVVIGGAELFTGNNLIVIAWASKKVSTKELLRNWMIVYAGNFVGSVATAIIMFLTKQYTFGANSVGIASLNIAIAKCSLLFGQALALGILCNALVCLAVWLSYSGRSTTDKIFAIIPPIAAFVAAGFEHSVANMYFIFYALLIKVFDPGFALIVAEKVPNLALLTWKAFVLGNLVPVTIGNIIGGAIFVAIVYWFVFLKQ